MARASRRSKRAGLDHAAGMDDPLEAAFQAYLNRMTKLLPNNGRHPRELADMGSDSARARALAMVRRTTAGAGDEPPDSPQESHAPELDPRSKGVAQARTLAVLRHMDGRRKGIVLRFLYSAGLIGKDAVISLNSADLSEADLSGANLWGANLTGADLRHTLFHGAKLPAAILHRADLRHADLSNADLWSADLSEADLTGVRANMANFGVANLTKTYLHEADLSEANLTGAILVEANLALADLRAAVLSKANLQETVMWGNNLSDANLIGANLSGADLSGADLTRADLTGANLRWAQITGQQLAQAASLKDATMPDGKRQQ